MVESVECLITIIGADYAVEYEDEFCGVRGISKEEMERWLKDEGQWIRHNPNRVLTLEENVGPWPLILISGSKDDRRPNSQHRIRLFSLAPSNSSISAMIPTKQFIN